MLVPNMRHSHEHTTSLLTLDLGSDCCPHNTCDRDRKHVEFAMNLPRTTQYETQSFRVTICFAIKAKEKVRDCEPLQARGESLIIMKKAAEARDRDP